MKLSRISLIATFTVLLFFTASAQEKKVQAGIRMGVTSGFTGRVINSDMWSLEGMIGFRSGGAQLYGLLEKHKQLDFPRTDRFSLYYGGGAHFGFVGYHKYYAHEYYDHYDYWDRYGNYGVAFGIDAVLGMEYSLRSVPITFGVDYKPFFEFYGPFYFRVNFWDFAAGIRYTF